MILNGNEQIDQFNQFQLRFTVIINVNGQIHKCLNSINKPNNNEKKTMIESSMNNKVNHATRLNIQDNKTQHNIIYNILRMRRTLNDQQGHRAKIFSVYVCDCGPYETDFKKNKIKKKDSHTRIFIYIQNKNSQQNKNWSLF